MIIRNFSAFEINIFLVLFYYSQGNFKINGNFFLEFRVSFTLN